MMKQKKLKSSANLSTEDLSSLAIFKSVVSEAGSLRNHLTKQKIHQLNFSQLLAQPKPAPKPNSNRRAVLSSLVDIKVGEVTFDSRRVPS